MTYVSLFLAHVRSQDGAVCRILDEKKREFHADFSGQICTLLDNLLWCSGEGNTSESIHFHTVHSGELVVRRNLGTKGYFFAMDLPNEEPSPDIPSWARNKSPLLHVDSCSLIRHNYTYLLSKIYKIPAYCSWYEYFERFWSSWVSLQTGRLWLLFQEIWLVWLGLTYLTQIESMSTRTHFQAQKLFDPNNNESGTESHNTHNLVDYTLHCRFSVCQVHWHFFGHLF